MSDSLGAVSALAGLAAIENGARGRVNRVTRAVMAQLGLTRGAAARNNGLALLNPQPYKKRGSMQFIGEDGTKVSVDAADIASAVSSAVAAFKADRGGAQFKRGSASQWWKNAVESSGPRGQALAASPEEAKKLRGLRNSIKRQVARELGLLERDKTGKKKMTKIVDGKPKRVAYVTLAGTALSGAKGKRYSASRKRVAMDAAEFYGKGFAEKVQGTKGANFLAPRSGGKIMVRGVPHKPRRTRVSKWLGSEDAATQMENYGKEYIVTPFARYGADKVQWRGQVAQHLSPEARSNPYLNPVRPGNEGGRGMKGPRKDRKYIGPESPMRDGEVTWFTAGPYKSMGALIRGKRGINWDDGLPAGRFGYRKGKKTLQEGDVPYDRKRAARSNPGSALVNPMFEPQGTLVGNAKEFLFSVAAPVAVSGALAGAVHALAASNGFTAKVEGALGTVATTVESLPVVGTTAAAVIRNGAYTVQGCVVGAALTAASLYVGGNLGRQLSIAAGSVIGFGAGIDAFNAIAGSSTAAVAQENMGDLAFEQLGDLAFVREPGLGDLGFNGAQGGSAAASLSHGSLAGDDLAGMYGQCSYADAYYSGADFSGVEGQALLNGSGAWTETFGRPSHRIAGRTALGPSHLAGREGHRWGWLIATLGTERARALCALPPAQRLRTIERMRKAAIAAFERSRKQEQAQLEESVVEEESSYTTPDLLPAAGTVLAGATGATNYLGEPGLFMGA